MADTKQKKKQSKSKSKSKQVSKSVPSGTSINVNVMMTNAADKVTRIKSRRRPNMREMRRRLGPGFYGGIEGLSNNAMNTLQNQRYALETDIRGLQAQRAALVGPGGAGAGGGGGGGGANNALQAINQQLANLQGQLTRVAGNLAGLGTQHATDVQRLRANIRQTREELEGEVRRATTPGVTPIPEDPSLAGYVWAAQPTPAPYASGRRGSVGREPEPEPEALFDSAQDVAAAYQRILASPVSQGARSRVAEGINRMRGRGAQEAQVVDVDHFAADLAAQQEALRAVRSGEAVYRSSGRRGEAVADYSKQPVVSQVRQYDG